MARPTKEGLDYFPLVTNFEDKVILLIAEFGACSVGIIVSLYQKIYDNSYYINWNEDSLMLFSRYINEEIELVNTVITRCFDRGIFDKAMYEKHGILTSHGIQKQYLKVCKDARRKRVGFVKEYCLVKDKDLLGIITELTSVNTEETLVNDNISTQSKVQESKVQESKVLEGGSGGGDVAKEECLQSPNNLQELKNVTPDERKTLSVLKSIELYPFDFEKDIDFIRTLVIDYPELDFVYQVKKWRDYKLDKPLTSKSSPRSQLRNWMNKANEWRSKSNGKAGRNITGGPARADPAGRYREFVTN